MTKCDKEKEQEEFLKIFEDRSEYVTSSGDTEEFKEGKVSVESKARVKLIKESLGEGFLEKIITNLKHSKTTVSLEELDPETIENISVLVESVTSEVGRALVGLTVMQLSIKSISPEQNIRLHKGSVNKNSFSWVDGISMRVLDKNFVTPVLRKYKLLNLNADGFMMTRSLAENYPYTKLYKAQLRGARQQWLNIVESVETGNSNPIIALKYLISLLLNKASDFDDACNALLDEKNKYLTRNKTGREVMMVITNHIEKSNYAARLMEVAMHSLMQAVISTGVFVNHELKPLSQMRSANKKHGNIGDIELLENNEIIESWDAKYGKNYLRDEIDEISEKLEFHEKVETIGFVTTDSPVRNDEISEKINDAKELHGLDILIMSFEDWIDWNFDRVHTSGLSSKEDLSNMWLSAYAESLAQKRRNIAPIDEPCFDWVSSLTNELKSI
tara:strand:+ start:445 stop:1776 length:1332 start_codon:yes stop_codon:yes gene_type:complete